MTAPEAWVALHSPDVGWHVRQGHDGQHVFYVILEESAIELAEYLQRIEDALIAARMGKVDERLGRIRAEARERVK